MMTVSSERPLAALDRDLAAIIEQYSRVTEQLRESHEQLEQQVRKLRDELADKNQRLARSERLAAIGHLAAGLAHEIRNPLGGIHLFASLLEKDLKHVPEQHALVQKVLSGVIMLDGLVNDILDFGREIKLQLTEVNVSELTEACLDYLAPLTAGTAATVVTALPAELVVQADLNQLRSALLNLLRNAVEAGGDQGKTTVSATEIRSGRAVQVRISDTGPGIPSEHLDNIFNPFFTTKETGNGLGLSMVHRIIDAHGGQIHVDRPAAGGACFVIEIPRNPAAQAADDSEEASS